MLRKLSLLLMMLTISFQSLSEKKRLSFYENIIGKYSYTQQGDELIDGRNASVTWVLKFLSENKVQVSITSWHASFTCDGMYQAEKNNDEIKLTWLASEGSEMGCSTPSPQFFIKKKSNGALLIKSELFSWDDNKWFALRAVN